MGEREELGVGVREAEAETTGLVLGVGDGTKDLVGVGVRERVGEGVEVMAPCTVKVNRISPRAPPTPDTAMTYTRLRVMEKV